MKKPSIIGIRILMTASLAVCSISSAMGDDLNNAANTMFGKLKLNPQLAQPQPNMPQSPMTMPPMPVVPPELMPPPPASFAVPPEFMPEAIKASNPSAVTIPAVSQGAPDAQGPAVTPNDGSIPLPAVDYPNNTQHEPDVSEGTEGEGIADGNVAPLT